MVKCKIKEELDLQEFCLFPLEVINKVKCTKLEPKMIKVWLLSLCENNVSVCEHICIKRLGYVYHTYRIHLNNDTTHL